MNLKAKVERDEKVPIKKVNNRTHFFERVHKTKEVRQQKSTKSIKHQKSSKSNEVKPTKKFKNAKELINLKEVKNTKEVKTHILVFLPFVSDTGRIRYKLQKLAQLISMTYISDPLFCT